MASLSLAERLGREKVDELMDNVASNSPDSTDSANVLDSRYVTPSRTFQNNLFNELETKSNRMHEVNKMTTHDRWNPSLDLILVEAMERNNFRNKRLTPDDRQTLLKALGYDVSETGLIYKLGTLRRNGFRNYKNTLAKLVAGGALKLSEIDTDFVPIHKGRPRTAGKKDVLSLEQLVDKAKVKTNAKAKANAKLGIKLDPEHKTEVEAESTVDPSLAELSSVVQDITPTVEDVISSKDGVINVKSLPFEVEITIRIKPAR